MPASLEGTDVPDGLLVDGNGNLIISTSLRDVFDYFLSTLGEEDIDTIVARLRAYIAHQLPASAAAEANRILDNYLAFRESLVDLVPAGGQINEQLDIQAVRQQQDAIRAQRQQFLSADVEQAFYAAEDQWNDFGLDRLAVLQDESLSTEQRAERLSELRESLPGELQADVDAVLRYQDLQALTAQLEQEGGTDADLRLLREQVVGPEAADRLEAVEAQRAQFQTRINQWLAQRDTLLADENLALGDRQQQVSQLREQQFSEEELIRVTTLERLHDEQSR